MAKGKVIVKQTNRNAIKSVDAVREANTSTLKANTTFVKIEETTGPLRITLGVTKGTKGKSETEVIVRIEANTTPDDMTHATFRAKVNGKIEIGMNSVDAANFLLKNKIFNSLLPLKINQFTGALGEAIIVRKMKTGKAKFHIYDETATQATRTVEFSFVENSVMSLQHSRTKNGLDIIGKIVNSSPPPPDFWVIFEVKTSAFHNADAVGMVQNVGTLAKKQKDGIDYVIDRIENAFIQNKKNPNSYVMDEQKYDTLMELQDALQRQKDGGEVRVLGFVSGQGIDEKYRLVTNDACPEGMSSLSLFFKDKMMVETIETIFGVNIPFHPDLK
jgi:PHD/YefM family antitoxin component YafN of YafNO toxin-antitoxin module